MAKAKRVILVSYRSGRKTKVSAKTAARVPGEINRRMRAQWRKAGNG